VLSDNNVRATITIEADNWTNHLPKVVPLASPGCPDWAQSRGPFTQYESRMPKAQGPEKDRNDVLNPAMERCNAARGRRQMGRRCIKKDANQDVDRDEDASRAEKCLQKVHLSPHPLLDACDLVPRGTLRRQTLWSTLASTDVP
jgi:hypothetical protein